MQRKLFALTLGILVGLSAATARAEEPPKPPTKEEAAEGKRHFDVGLKLYAEHAYVEALTEFEASYQSGHRASALKNVAQCQRDLKRFAEAYESYELLLGRHGAELSEADRTGVKHALEELAVLTGTLDITSDPPGATISLDGKELGVTPLGKPRRTGIGAHHVKATLAGYSTFDRDVTVGSESVAVVRATMTLESTKGRLAIREAGGHPSHLFLDGVDKGPAPFAGDVPAGDHTVVLRSERYVSDERTVTVKTGESVDLTLDAVPVAGHVRVNVAPAEARIRIDGKELATGVFDGDLPPGPHRVDLDLAGFSTAFRTIEVRRGESATVDVTLVRGEDEPVYPGMYGRVALVGGIGPPNRPPTPNGAHQTVESNPTVGGGLTLHIGRSFGWWSLEVASSYHFTYGKDKISCGGAVADCTDRNYETFGFSGFLGVGPRVTSKASVARFTFGAAPGIFVRGYHVDRSDNNNGNNGGRVCNQSPDFLPCTSGPGGPNGSGSNDETFGGGYVDFGFHADGGLLLGWTPGAKFFIGATAWLDFAPDVVVGPDTLSADPNSNFASPGRGTRVFSGPQLFFGPTLGVQWGH